LRFLFSSYSTEKDNEILLHYLNTGLNLPQAKAYIHDDPWPKYPQYVIAFLKVVHIMFDYIINSTVVIWFKKMLKYILK
jgi:hypothetical protein